jgi:hypothetical protein
MLQAFKPKSANWYLALAEAQRRQDKCLAVIAPPLLKAKAKKRKKPKKAKQAKLREEELTWANWVKPEAPQMEIALRDQLFEELVRTDQGTVHYVERWADTIPSPPRKRQAVDQAPAHGYYELEAGLSSVLRRNVEL